MGLLSDPEYGSAKWVRVLKKIHAPLCLLCYVAALVWFVMLGNKEFNNETYFSENALLPGLVKNEFNGEQAARKFLQEFQQELEDKYSDSDRMPVPWLVAKMSQLNLEVYTHNFTLNYPMGSGEEKFTGTNIYGILRAPRTSSLEALVVSAPYRPLVTHMKGTTAGIALMLAFAQFARPQKYWAKDIIFLITEHEQLGMQAWLEAYHGIQSDAETFYTSLGSFWKPGTLSLDLGRLAGSWRPQHEKCLNPGKLRGRSGSIQAAINLEFHIPKIKYIEVKVEGLNGQLPNLDLVNLVHKLCVKSGIHHSYKNSYSWVRSRDKIDEWLNGVHTMMGMVTAQIAGVPNGNHGLFHRFGIEAVTLEGRAADDPAGSPPRAAALAAANFHRLGVALESVLRSLNNLLERFHQSYFFYLLAATNRFISIGQYMPCLCLLCVAMLIRALYLWVTTPFFVLWFFSSMQDDDESEKKHDKHKSKRKNSHAEDVIPGDKEQKDIGMEKENEGGDYDRDKTETSLRKRKSSKLDSEIPAEHIEKKSSEKEKPKKGKARKEFNAESGMSVVNVGGNYLLVHLLGYAVMNLPVFFSKLGAKYYSQATTDAAVFDGLAAVSVLLVIITPFLPRLLRTRPITHEELSLVNILVLIELATVCLTVGMHNFPLGLAIATLYTPLALVTGVVVKGGGKRRAILVNLKRVFCLLLHPLSVVTIGLILYSRVQFPEFTLLEMVSRGWQAATTAVMFAVVDSLIYGNWLFNVAASVLLPIWIIFWQILCNKVDMPES